MIQHKLRYILAAIPIASASVSAQTTPQDELPRLLTQIESTEAEVVVSALEKMGRVCDQSCIPAISDKIHHDEASVIKAACHAAFELADPRFAPALMDVVRNHPLDDVRIEALKALTRIGRTEDYESLFENADFKHPDWIAQQIIRSLPKDAAIIMLDHISELATEPSLITSIVHGYRDFPDALFLSLISLLQRGQFKDSEDQIYRALALISPQLASPELPKELLYVFWIHPPNTSGILDDIATIQANRSTDDALHWLLSYGSQLSPSSLINVIEAIHGPNADLFIDALFTNAEPDLNYQTHIAPYPEIVNALLIQHSVNPHIQSLAVDKIHEQNFTESALQALYNIRTAETTNKILGFLGHQRSAISQTAMRITGNDPAYWSALVSIIQSDTQIDSYGRVYAARWAAAMLASQYHDQLSDTTGIISEALSCIQSPHRLHAEPALWLLNVFNADIQIDLQTFQTLRPDMKRAWLQYHHPSIHDDILNAALHDKDPSVAAQALIYFCDEPAIQPNETWTALIHQYIRSENPLLSLNAILTAGKKQIHSAVPLLKERLNDADAKVVYNAIWALQQLQSLPDTGILATIYYRASDGFLKKRLGFLTGLAEDRKEDKQMYEIETQKPLLHHALYQVLFQNRPRSTSDIAIMRSDMAIEMIRTNVMGMIYTP